VPASGDHDQAPAAHVDDQCLVVDDGGVVPPLGTVPGLVGRGHAPFELGRAVHLAGDQDAAGQQRGLPPFDHLEPLPLQGTPRQDGHLQAPAAGQLQAPAGPDRGMNRQRQAGPPAEPGQAIQTARVVEVPVTQHDALQAADINAKTLGVHRQRIRRGAGTVTACCTPS